MNIREGKVTTISLALTVNIRNTGVSGCKEFRDNMGDIINLALNTGS